MEDRDRFEGIGKGGNAKQARANDYGVNKINRKTAGRTDLRSQIHGPKAGPGWQNANELGTLKIYGPVYEGGKGQLGSDWQIHTQWDQGKTTQRRARCAGRTRCDSLRGSGPGRGAGWRLKLTTLE